MLTAQEVYTNTVRDLTPAERLRLIGLIVNDLAPTEMTPVDYADWTAEDIEAMTRYSLQIATERYGEEDLV